METPKEFFDKIVSGEISFIYFVENSVSESQFLEFKRFFNVKEQKKSIAKYFTQFLNSDGGVIVWGVICEPCDKTKLDVATSLSPSEDPKKFFQNLETYISTTISPPPSGILHKIVDDEYLVSYIPKGENRPYQDVNSGIYHFRAGGQNLRMTHQMIVDAVLARKSAVIVLEVGEDELWYKSAGQQCRRINFRVKNISAISNQKLLIYYNSKSTITSHSDNVVGVPDFELESFPTKRFHKFVRSGAGSELHPGLSFRFQIDVVRNYKEGEQVEFCFVISSDNNSSAYHFIFEAKHATTEDGATPITWHRVEKLGFQDTREIFEYEKLPTTKLIQYPSSELS